MSRFLMLGLALMVVTGLACNNPMAAPGQPTKTTEAKAPAAPKSTPAKPAVKTPPAPVKSPDDIVDNGSFEQWEKGRPAGWTVSEGRKAAWKNVTVKQASPASSGKAALAIPEPKADQLVMVSQGFDGKKVKLGSGYRAGARIKATAEGQAFLLVSYKEKGKEKQQTKRVAGTGKWENIAIYFKLPAEADPASLKISVVRNPQKPGPVLLDDVTVKPVAG